LGGVGLGTDFYFGLDTDFAFGFSTDFFGDCFFGLGLDLDLDLDLSVYLDLECRECLFLTNSPD
jgi:hypothetical protein